MQGIVDEERQRDHPQPPSARRVATGRACLGCCSSSPMSPHRLVVTPATQARRARNKHHRIYGPEHLVVHYVEEGEGGQGSQLGVFLPGFPSQLGAPLG